MCELTFVPKKSDMCNRRKKTWLTRRATFYVSLHFGQTYTYTHTHTHTHWKPRWTRMSLNPFFFKNSVVEIKWMTVRSSWSLSRSLLHHERTTLRWKRNRTAGWNVVRQYFQLRKGIRVQRMQSPFFASLLFGKTFSFLSCTNCLPKGRILPSQPFYK